VVKKGSPVLFVAVQDEKTGKGGAGRSKFTASRVVARMAAPPVFPLSGFAPPPPPPAPLPPSLSYGSMGPAPALDVPHRPMSFYPAAPFYPQQHMNPVYGAPPPPPRGVPTARPSSAPSSANPSHQSSSKRKLSPLVPVLPTAKVRAKQPRPSQRSGL